MTILKGFFFSSAHIDFLVNFIPPHQLTQCFGAYSHWASAVASVIVSATKWVPLISMVLLTAVNIQWNNHRCKCRQKISVNAFLRGKSVCLHQKRSWTLSLSCFTSSNKSVTLNGGPRSATKVLKDMESSTRVVKSSSIKPRCPRKLAWN